MTNIKHLIIAFLILIVAWFVSVVLTQQRLQIESESMRLAQNKNLSPLQWNFSPTKEDIVESFISYWELNKDSIQAKKESNPKLSLNFSGFVINSLHHQQLILNSKQNLHGYVTIEFQTNLEDEFYYYSPRIQIKGQSQVIDLQTTWRGINKDKSQIIKAPWGTAKGQVSSLVLHFENPWKDLQIDSISMPYIDRSINHDTIEVTCDGNIGSSSSTNLFNFIHFELNEYCLFPSNYMWLKQQLSETYPGSTISLKNNLSWTKIKPFLINQSFTSISLINAIFYTFILLVLLIIYKLRNSFSIKVVKKEPWNKWLIKKVLMQKVLPYHFVFSYAVILMPTLILLTVMALIKFPTLDAFKDLPMYFLWAVIQQFILGYILAERIFNQRIQNKFISALLAGLVFSIFHMPSTTLMIATFVGGSCWALAWLWFKRFIPLALSHTLLALMFYYVTANQYLYSAKVLQWFWK